MSIMSVIQIQTDCLKTNINKTIETIETIKTIDQNLINQIIAFFNKPLVGSNSFELLKNCTCWDNIEITKYYINTKHICLFHYNNNTYVTDSHTVELLELGKNIANYKESTQIFLMYMKDKQIIEVINGFYEGICNEIRQSMSDIKSKIYHFLIKHNKFKKICCHSSNDNGISLIWVTDKKCNILNPEKITEDIIVKKIPYEKKIYFSCLDELLTSVDILNNDCIMTKTIQFGGYHVKIYNQNQNTKFALCVLTPEIYNYILTTVYTNSQIIHQINQINPHKIFMELYQHDKLTEILPYLHKYPAAVVERINKSVKTLAKEILNIYHLTRKQQNSNLYDALSSEYKIILFNLHKIYVNQKYSEFIVKNTETDKMLEKKSISVDIVYGYLKGMKTCDLLDLFETRIALIKKLQDIKFNFNGVLIIENIYIITQTELMFPSNI